MNVRDVVVDVVDQEVIVRVATVVVTLVVKAKRVALPATSTLPSVAVSVVVVVHLLSSSRKLLAGYPTK
jgi:hypothetical protein